MARAETVAAREEGETQLEAARASATEVAEAAAAALRDAEVRGAQALAAAEAAATESAEAAAAELAAANMRIDEELSASNALRTRLQDAQSAADEMRTARERVVALAVAREREVADAHEENTARANRTIASFRAKLDAAERVIKALGDDVQAISTHRKLLRAQLEAANVRLAAASTALGIGETSAEPIPDPPKPSAGAALRVYSETDVDSFEPTSLGDACDFGSTPVLAPNDEPQGAEHDGADNHDVEATDAPEDSAGEADADVESDEPETADRDATSDGDERVLESADRHDPDDAEESDDGDDDSNKSGDDEEGSDREDAERSVSHSSESVSRSHSYSRSGSISSDIEFDFREPSAEIEVVDQDERSNDDTADDDVEIRSADEFFAGATDDDTTNDESDADNDIATFEVEMEERVRESAETTPVEAAPEARKLSESDPVMAAGIDATDSDAFEEPDDELINVGNAVFVGDADDLADLDPSSIDIDEDLIDEDDFI